MPCSLQKHSPRGWLPLKNLHLSQSIHTLLARSTTPYLSVILSCIISLILTFHRTTGLYFDGRVIFFFNFCTISGGPLNSADTISLLTHAKLFREAVRLARLFKQAVDPILKGLAHTCLHPPLLRPPTLEDNDSEFYFHIYTIYLNPVV